VRGVGVDTDGAWAEWPESVRRRLDAAAEQEPVARAAGRGRGTACELAEHVRNLEAHIARAEADGFHANVERAYKPTLALWREELAELEDREAAR